jgi:membrane protein DedA with SNARE-associated domain
MTFGDISDVVLTFVRNHEIWAAPIVFALAFGESLAFISLLLPATAVLFGVGGLIGAAGIGFWAIWLAAALGAVLGDWVSYWLGFHYKHAIGQIWPLSRHPGLLARGEAFFQK